MARHLVIICLFFLTSQAFAKTVVISDIDDTIRSLHCQSGYLEMFGNAQDSHRAFARMSELFNDLDTAGDEIFYVSAVVAPFIDLSTDFLEASGFPQADHFYNKGWFEDTTEFKVQRIESILEQEKPDHIILLGDNGDHDVEVYQRIADEFHGGGNRIDIFIHKLYTGDGLMIVPVGENIFLTAADLAVQLEARGALTDAQTSAILKNILKDSASKDPFIQDMLWPSWGEATTQDIAEAFATPSPSPENQKDLQAVRAVLFP